MKRSGAGHHCLRRKRVGVSYPLPATHSSINYIEDYNTLLTILPSDAPQRADVKRALASLKPRLEAAQKAETAEMLDKLKGMGNSILGTQATMILICQLRYT